MTSSHFDRLTLDDLRRRRSAKWQVYPDDVLPLWVAEMDVLPAPSVVDAVVDAMQRGDTGYAMEEPYREALRAFAEDRWGWRFDVAASTTVADVMRGAMEVIEQATRPGGGVVVSPPVYPPFFQFIAHGDRRVVEAPLGGDGRLDLDALERAFADATTDGPAAYLLCSPQNPTGTVHTRDELIAVAELAASYGVRVVADEIHAPLVLPGAGFVPYLDVAGDADAVAVHSASKGWNLPGLKAAVAVFGEAARPDLARLPEIVPHGASHLGVISHTAALRDGRDWLDTVIADIAANTRRFGELLAARLPGAVYRPGAATYLAWVDLRGVALGDDPAGRLLERGRVAVVAGPDFGTGGEGHVRVNLATSPSILEEAVDRMAASVG